MNDGDWQILDVTAPASLSDSFQNAGSRVFSALCSIDYRSVVNVRSIDLTQTYAVALAFHLADGSSFDARFNDVSGVLYARRYDTEQVGVNIGF